MIRSDHYRRCGTGPLPATRWQPLPECLVTKRIPEIAVAVLDVHRKGDDHRLAVSVRLRKSPPARRHRSSRPISACIGDRDR